MTTTTRNEAAERLRMTLAAMQGPTYLDDFDDALAAERRATVERFILAMKDGELPGSTAQEKAGIQYAALWLAKTFRDEEAAR
jgi:hypothetical protein